MDDFDSPLDLDGDGDDAMEMCLFFDDDDKKKHTGSKPPSNSGCCIVLLAMGAAVLTVGWSVITISKNLYIYIQA